MTLTKRELQAQATKAKILTTAIALIEQNGYDEVTISQICKACHVAKGSFYTHFTSKRDIAIELLKGINIRMFNDMAIDPDKPADTQLLDYIQRYFLTVMACGAAMSREILKIIYSVPFSRLDVASDLHNRFIAGYIALGQEQGIFNRELMAEQIAQYWSDGNLNLVRNWTHEPERYDLQQHGQQYGMFMLGAIK